MDDKEKEVLSQYQFWKTRLNSEHQEDCETTIPSPFYNSNCITCGTCGACTGCSGCTGCG